MKEKRKFKDYFLITLKGIGMGAADVVPGVSGGTIAFISGIYEELLDAIKSVNATLFKKLFKEGIVAAWNHLNANFLVALLLGIAISFLSLAKLMQYLLDNHAVLIWSFFFGLILASTVYVGQKIKKWNIPVIIGAIVGAIVAYIITDISPAASVTYTPLWFIFVSGAVAICAMILPGISGSFILLLMGQYRYILNALTELKFDVIIVFILGAAIGLISFSNVLSWLLKRFHDITVAILTGFMLGSLNKVWPWKQVTETVLSADGKLEPLAEKNVLPQIYEQVTGLDANLAFAILLAIGGFILVFGIERLATPKNAPKSETV